MSVLTRSRGSRLSFCGVVCAAVSGAGFPNARDVRPAEPIRVSNALLLDSRLVESADGLRLVLGEVRKDSGNPLMVADRPWEQRLDNVYANVQYDEARRVFRCWYSPFIEDTATSGTPARERAKMSYGDARRRLPHREMGLCYATSTDGIAWSKPELNRHNFAGSTENNLVLRYPGPRLDGPHGTGVIRDAHDPDPARRYKAVFSMDRRLWVTSSPNGLDWCAPSCGKGIDLSGDTHNNMLWVPSRKTYVAFSRAWSNGVRQVVRTESSDLVTWSDAQVALEGVDGRHQTYAMLVFPCAELYLGLVMIFDTTSDRVHCELAASVDTVNWRRVCPGKAFIENGPDGSSDAGCIFAAAYPIAQGGETLLYYGGSDKPHSNWRDSFLCRATMPTDRWAGYQPLSQTLAGHLITNLMILVGDEVSINVVASGGTVQLDVLDVDGSVLAQSEPICDDATDQQICWRAGHALRERVGRPVRLRFTIDRATVYGFHFR
jgi:hypothetical protein